MVHTAMRLHVRLPLCDRGSNCMLAKRQVPLCRPTVSCKAYSPGMLSL